MSTELRKRCSGGSGSPWSVHQRRDRADAQRLADVARQRLRHRAVVLHPVELPDVPEVRIADRRVADLVVGRGSDGRRTPCWRCGRARRCGRSPPAPDRGGAADCSGRCRAGLDGRAQRLPQPALPSRVARAEHLLREAIELPRARRRCRPARPAASGRRCRAHVGEGVHGLAAVDADRRRSCRPCVSGSRRCGRPRR